MKKNNPKSGGNGIQRERECVCIYTYISYIHIYLLQFNKQNTVETTVRYDFRTTSMAKIKKTYRAKCCHIRGQQNHHTFPRGDRTWHQAFGRLPGSHIQKLTQTNESLCTQENLHTTSFPNNLRLETTQMSISGGRDEMAPPCPGIKSSELRMHMKTQTSKTAH